MMGFVNNNMEPSCSASLGSFPMAGFGIIGIELLCSDTVQLPEGTGSGY
jgi:hypothetical protein